MRTSKNIKILIIGADFKVKEWRKSFEANGDELISLRNGLWLVFDFVKYLMCHGRADAIVLRYLNDRRSFFGSLRLAIGEWLVIIIGRIVSMRVIWICHNVDQETKMLYPRLTRVRRWLAARLASRIFVTDPLLQRYVSKYLPSGSDRKVDWLTFGAYRSETSNKLDPAVEEIQQFGNKFRERVQADGATPLVGLCLGAPGAKYAHFDYARTLVHASKQTQYRVALILGGDFSKDLTERQRQEFQLIAEEPDVLFIPRYVRVNESSISDNFDFFWRGYRDLSMSYTLYVAASVNRPVLALDSGFVGTAVREYELGAVVRSDFSDLERALELLETWETDKGKRFLESHHWDIGAARLRGAVRI